MDNFNRLTSSLKLIVILCASLTGLVSFFLLAKLFVNIYGQREAIKQKSAARESESFELTGIK
jgi:hypothetical protein